MKYKYEEPDDYFIINNDPSLTPIKIYINKIISQVYKKYKTPVYIPNFKNIDGYGLDPKDQIFKLPNYPQRLKSLEDKVSNDMIDKYGFDKVTSQKILVELRRVLYDKRKEYKNEIAFIYTQWYYRLYGYWCYINGKPTYLAPSHYSYLTSWDMGSDGLPQYRDRDRRRALIETYLYTCTETFKNTKELAKGVVIGVPNDDGEYEMEDTGNRNMFGSVYPKPRRDGATHFALSFCYDIITVTTGSTSLMGIASFSEEAVTAYYKKMLLPAWDKKPFYFKPMWWGSDMPLGQLEFKSPTNVNFKQCLETSILPSDKAERSFYDGKKLFAILCDEEGKSDNLSLKSDWNKLIPCLAQGGRSKIHGYSMHPSSVEDMETGGGRQYYELCKQSNYYIRNSLNGQTSSGLVAYFIPSYDGFEGFIGKYGESIIDKPTPEQAQFIGKKHGARAEIESTRLQFLANKTPEGDVDYRDYVRKFPITYDECFYGNTGNVGFNIKKIDEAISRIDNLVEPPVKLGNFYLVGDLQTGRVVFREELNGRWELSKDLKEGQSNKRIKKYVIETSPSGTLQVAHWYPDRPRFVISADTYKFSKGNEKNAKYNNNGTSDGGGAIFELRDTSVDNMDKPISEWQTYNLVATYQSRPYKREDYANDMLYAAIYFGAMMYPEMEVEYIWEYFCQNKFDGYMLYGNDTEGKYRDKPGFFTSQYKQRLFDNTKNFIEDHAMRCNHKTWLEDCKTIKNMNDMTNYDRFTAVGGCLLAIECLSLAYMENKIESEFALYDIFVKH